MLIYAQNMYFKLYAHLTTMNRRIFCIEKSESIEKAAKYENIYSTIWNARKKDLFLIQTNSKMREKSVSSHKNYLQIKSE